MSGYTDGYQQMQVWLRHRRRSSSQAAGKLADLRAARKGLDPGSAEWMEKIGETTALLRAFPNLGHFSPTEPGRPDGAGVE